MMQKNLTVRTLKNAQKNMVLLGLSLLVVNLLFLSLGVFLSEFATANNIAASGDTLFFFNSHASVFPRHAAHCILSWSSCCCIF